MSRLAHWCFEHRRRVVAGWLLALVALFAVSTAVGSRFNTDSTLPGTDSQVAYNLLDANFPAAAGEGDQMVIHTMELAAPPRKSASPHDHRGRRNSPNHPNRTGGCRSPLTFETVCRL